MKFTSERCANFLVFYRDLPKAIETHIKADGRMSFIKDGVKKFGDQSCPRITICVNTVDVAKDKQRVDALNRLLEQLESNNQIVGFKNKKITIN